MSLRPSSLPMLAQCACFESGETEYTGPGTKRHRYLRAMVEPDSLHMETIGDGLPDDEREAVDWAAAYILMMVAAYKIDAEHRLTLYDDAFKEVFSGTPDVVCGNEIFDLKWRERNYDAQMAAYALMLLQSHNFKTVVCHVLFAESQRVQKLVFDRESAEAIVYPIIEVYRSVNKQPTPNDYCGWCANRLRCKALLARVQAVADGREDWAPQQFHASKMEDPTEMAKALRLARQIKKWAEGVEYHAKLMAEKEMLPGFEWKNRKGRAYCDDVLGAYHALGLTPEQFLQGCDVRLNTSKKYPDRYGITEIYAANHDMKLAPAKKAVLGRLENFGAIKRGEDTRSLVAVGETSNE